MVGEGGQRGGYLEAIGFPPEIHEQIRKLITYTLQPATAGQILVDLMVDTPRRRAKCPMNSTRPSATAYFLAFNGGQIY